MAHPSHRYSTGWWSRAGDLESLPYHHPRQQNQHQGPEEEPSSPWLASLASGIFDRSGSTAAGVTSNAPPRRDELEGSQNDVRFYRNELEQSNYDLQRAIGDNSAYARRIQELENANARLNEQLLGRRLQVAQGVPAFNADGFDRRSSSAYTSGLKFQ